MHLIAPAPAAFTQTSKHTLTVCLLTAVLLAMFYTIEHGNKEVSNLHAFTLTADEVAERVTEGDATRRFAIPMLAGFGALLLLRREGFRVGIHSMLGWLLLGYIGWCGLSIAWSDEPSLTLRRTIVLYLCCLGAVGVARQVTLRDLCVITLAVTTILLGYDIYTELAHGTFHPFSADYRFAGTLHPNAQAPNCATMSLAAGCLAMRAQRGRSFLWTLCVIGGVLMVLTKSRTVCFAFVAGLLVYNLYGARLQKKIFVIATILWIAATAAWIGTMADWDLEGTATNALMAGREEESESLSGRLPLWEAMLPSFFDRPLLGHGYQTFWLPKRIANFSYQFQYTVPDGHSAYLDAAMDLGIVGATLCLITVFTGVREAGRRYLVTGDIGFGFLFALFACRSLNALLESNFAVPTSFVPFIMMCGLAHLGLCRDPVRTDFIEPSLAEVT